MSISDKSIKSFQDLFEKKYGKKLSWEEAAEAGNNLVDFFELLYNLDIKEQKRRLRLKDEPKGFRLDDGVYNCGICYARISDKQTWYDQYGIKCLLCQKAVENDPILGEACEDKDAWYDMWDLERWYKVKSATARKLVRDGKLKARVVPREDGKPHFYVFMIKDNPGVLKVKPKGQTVKIGENKFTIEYPEFNEKIV